MTGTGERVRVGVWGSSLSPSASPVSTAVSPPMAPCLSCTAITDHTAAASCHISITTCCAHHDIAHVMSVTAVLVSCATCYHSPRCLHTPQGAAEAERPSLTTVQACSAFCMAHRDHTCTASLSVRLIPP